VGGERGWNKETVTRRSPTHYPVGPEKRVLVNIEKIQQRESRITFEEEGGDFGVKVPLREGGEQKYEMKLCELLF